MKNIAFLVRDITANGGVERVVITLVNNLSRIYKYKTSIISLNKPNGNSIEFDLDSNVEVIYLNYKAKYKGSMRSCMYELLYIKKELNKLEMDVLITTTTYHNVYLSILNKFFKFKSIASHHEEYSSDTEKWNKLKRMFYKNLDGIILLTNSDYNIYKELNKNCYVIPNAVPFESKYLYNENSKKIVTIGRLSVEKSIEYSINAFAELYSKYPEWSLEIVGEGSESCRLKGLIEQLNLQEYIKITGFNNNIVDKYKEAAFTVLTSQKEGFGCVIIESKAVGVPVISFDNVGPREIINNRIDGYLVEKNNIKELIQAMDKLMNNTELRDVMSREAYVNAKYFSIEKICSMWNSVLNEGGVNDD